MRKTVYSDEEIKKYTEPMPEPMKHQVQDAMLMKIPKEYIQILVDKKISFYTRAYLIGCILDQDDLNTIKMLAQKESAEEMCLLRRSLLEKEFFRGSSFFTEYQSLSKEYKNLIARVQADQKQIQEIVCLLSEQSKREKQESASAGEQAGNEKLQRLQQENEMLKNETGNLQKQIAEAESEKLNLQAELQKQSDMLQEKTEEAEKLHRKNNMLLGIGAKDPEQTGTNVIVYEKPEEGKDTLFFVFLKKAIRSIRKKKRRKEQKERQRFMSSYINQNATEPDKVEFLMALYQSGWSMEDMEKISAGEHLDEMNRIKNSVERQKFYQQMLEHK